SLPRVLRRRRRFTSQEKGQHGVFPQQRPELPRHRRRVTGRQKLGFLGLSQKTNKGLCIRFLPQRVQGAHHLRRSLGFEHRESKHGDHSWLGELGQKGGTEGLQSRAKGWHFLDWLQGEGLASALGPDANAVREHGLFVFVHGI